MSHKVIAQLGDKQIIIESGKLAKQADGAVTVQLGETIVLVAAVAAFRESSGPEATMMSTLRSTNSCMAAGYRSG